MVCVFIHDGIFSAQFDFPADVPAAGMDRLQGGVQEDSWILTTYFDVELENSLCLLLNNQECSPF